MQVNLTVQFSCGCGACFRKQEGDLPGQAQKDAMAHAREAGHCLTVTGMVRPVKE